MIDGVGENENGDDKAGDDVDLVEGHGLTGFLLAPGRGASSATKAALDGTGWLPLHPARAGVPRSAAYLGEVPLGWQQAAGLVSSPGLGGEGD